jgi:hypothetical protein
MKMRYQFSNLSKEEKELLEMVLLEEMDIQSWFAITYSSMFSEELFIAIQ